jgi:serine protease AprX
VTGHQAAEYVVGMGRGMGIRRRRVQRLLASVASVGVLVSGSQSAQASLLGTVGGLLGSVVGVVSTALDTTTGLLTGADWGYSSSTASMQQVQQAVGAPALYAQGYTGRSIGVALLDTGVVPVQGLTAGNVINGPDLSLDGQGPGASYLDGFGHGTHMAGIIAGNDAVQGGFTGLAPGATLVSVRVGADDGAVDVSQVIAGIDWVIAHRHDAGVNIRVINLSYGTNSTQAYASDPLARAVENAWRAGIVVVAAGGNSGTNQPSLDDPALDPYVIAVGAADTTSRTLLPSVPSFSSRGSATRHVDLVAPGQSLVSLRDPGSVVDTEYPAARVNTRFFKGSGTSQAAAVVSGAVALLLQARPSLTPDQVKSLLMSTAQALPLAGSAAAGAGLLNVAAASTAPVVGGTQTWAPSSGLGSLEAARGTDHVVTNGVPLTGERDVLGAAWVPAVWAPASAAGTAWSGGVWNTKAWSGGCWCGLSWAPLTWAATRWTGTDWAGDSWSSHTWSAELWSSHTWSGAGWSSHTWSSHTWSSHSWS